MSTVTTVVQHGTGSPSISNKTTKRNKRHPNWQKSSTLSISEDMILYVENPKDFTPKLLEFSKVPGHKINAKKSVSFLYTNNEAGKRETKNRSHLQLYQKT